MGRVSNYSVIRGNAATFEVQVNEVLVGKAADNVKVTWFNGMAAVPDKMPHEPIVIALVHYTADSFNVMQRGACSDAFLFPIDSDQAREIRRILQP